MQNLVVNVTLTDEQTARIKSQVIDKRNIRKACQYADISYSTFDNAIGGDPLKSTQRDKLLEFCDKVEGIVSPTKAA